MRTFILLLFTLISFQVCCQDFDFEEFKKKQKESEDKLTEMILQIIESKSVTELKYQEWSSDAVYYQGDLVKYQHKAYESLADDNTNIPSDTSKYWKAGLIKEIILDGITVPSYVSWPTLYKKIENKVKSLADKSGRVKLEPFLRFTNCTFPSLTFQDLELPSIDFTDCKINSLDLYNIQTESISLQNCSIRLMRVTECEINNFFCRNIKDGTEMGLVDTKFGAFYASDLSNFEIISHICSFTGDTLPNNRTQEMTFHVESLTNCSFKAFKSTFGLPGDSSAVQFSGNINKIQIDSSTFYSNINVNASILERLRLTHNTINGLISINNAILPTDVKVRWSQLKGHKISGFGSVLKQNAKTGMYSTDKYFKPSHGDGVSNLDHYEDIMYSYQTLYTYYKNAGDLESANGCFSEMKDVQTERYAYLFSSEKTFKSFFRWKLAQLMKFYTSHGTDPARAIVISMWVMLAFAVFYFFFPSDWDVTSKSKLFSNYKDFIEKNEKGYIKPFFVLALGFSVSLINAFTLSVNSFTTLGFGNIPTHGIAKYFCVLEGFIGWFLLSIFTVALINQVLG